MPTPWGDFSRRVSGLQISLGKEGTLTLKWPETPKERSESRGLPDRGQAHPSRHVDTSVTIAVPAVLVTVGFKTPFLGRGWLRPERENPGLPVPASS